MRYRNEKTGAVIETDCTVTGGSWVPVKPAATGKKSTASPADGEKAKTDAEGKAK